MAVSVHAPQYSKLGMWNLGDPPSTYSSTGSEGVPASMSYQYSLPPAGLDSIPGMIPSFHHPPDHAQPPSPASTKPSSPSPKSRGGTAPSKAAKLKKSMSTPNVRGQASADAAALALSAEKRRNKLGYHRTSVACGHCRRRKIRCIPAPADPQNRCSNCMRLKKDCNFYPVDQQPPPDPSARRDSKAHSGPERASESTSPSTSSGQLPEMAPTLPYPHLTMPPIQDLGGPQMKRPRTESFSPENKVVTSSRNFEYHHPNPTNWMAPEPPSSAKTEAPQPYWRVNPQDSPITPAFSPYTPNLHIPPPQNWPPSHTEASPRDESSWNVPQRSMSYNSLDGLHRQQQHYSPYPHPLPPVSDHYTTKPRALQSMYPPPISTSGPPNAPSETSSATPIEPPPHPHSANSLPPVPYSNWQQPYSYQKPPSASSGPENYGGYHAGQPPHAQHEPRPPPPPPSSYGGYPEPTPPMYYSGSHAGR